MNADHASWIAESQHKIDRAKAAREALILALRQEVAAFAAGLLAAGAGVAVVVVALLPAVAGVAGWAVLPLLSWLHAASASRAAHRSGRRLNMATS